MKQYLNALSLLRIPLLAGVVFIHCNLLITLNIGTDNIESFANFIWWFDIVCLTPCVPAFFIISGYLFFRGATRLDGAFYRAKWRSRWYSLAVPYIIWNVLGLMITLYKASPMGGAYAETYAAYWPAGQSLGEWLGHIATGFFQLTTAPFPYDFPFWFVRDLIIFVIVSPIIGYALLRLGRWSLAMIVAVCLTMAQLTDCGQFISMIYISIGAWCSYYGSLKVSRVTVYAAVGVAVASVAVLYLAEMSGIVLNTVLILKNAAIAVLAYRVAVSAVGHGVEVSGWARSAAFFVYAIHGLYSGIVCKGLARVIHPDTSMACFEIYVATFVILVTTSLAAYWGLNKISPRITSVLCGGR